MLKFICNPNTLKLPEQYEDAFKASMRNIEAVEVTINPIYKTRTSSQNALFHSLCGKIAFQCGQNKDWVKQIVKRRAMDAGYPPKRDEKGEIEIYENEIIPKPTSQASISEMELLIETCHMIAMEFGFDLED